MSDDEEQTKPDTLQAILREVLLTRDSSETAADCALQLSAELKTVVQRLEDHESRLIRLEVKNYWLPMVMFSAMAVALAVIALLR